VEKGKGKGSNRTVFLPPFLRLPALPLPFVAYGAVVFLFLLTEMPKGGFNSVLKLETGYH
jgi:hypothetical protein